MADKIQFEVSHKDVRALSDLAEKIQIAFVKNTRKVYYKQHGHDISNENNEDDEVDDMTSSSGRISEANNYWMTLLNDQQERILHKYCILTGADGNYAWSRLHAQCTANIASALLSEDDAYHQWAITMLDKAFRNRGDIFTPEEKEMVHDQLQKKYGVDNISTRRRLIYLGLRDLDEKKKSEIREDIRMSDDRFEKLATMMLDNARAYDQARWARPNQKRKD